MSSGGQNGNATAWSILANDLGCSNAESQLSCVRGIDPVVIQKILNTTALSFHPVNDNVTQLAIPINRTLHQSVPYMIGTNGQEGRVFLVKAANATNLTIALAVVSLENLPDEIPNLNQDYAIPSTGISDAYDAASQIYTELVFQCGASIVANQSVTAGWPTWRYYYNASFPNINFANALAAVGETSLTLEAVHTSEIPLVFGNYPKLDAPDSEIGLSQTMQGAWANFVKNPDTTGPGWPRYGLDNGQVNPKGVAGLGLRESQIFEMIGEEEIDTRCPLYAAFYEKAIAPAF